MKIFKINKKKTNKLRHLFNFEKTEISLYTNEKCFNRMSTICTFSIKSSLKLEKRITVPIIFIKIYAI